LWPEKSLLEFKELCRCLFTIVITKIIEAKRANGIMHKLKWKCLRGVKIISTYEGLYQIAVCPRILSALEEIIRESVRISV